MILRRRSLAVLAAALLSAPLIAAILPASPAGAHGWIVNPSSRQDQCAKGAVASCGDIQYEPQSVEAPKGSRSCSGGSRFTVLDNDGYGWHAASVGSSVQFTWQNTAMHRTSDWQYYVDGSLFATVSGNNAQPPATVTHSINGLPGGRHKILGVWNIADTGNAFYSCVDVNVNGSGGGGGGGGGGTPPPTGCGGVQGWTASGVYTSGAIVSYNGRKYTARWWTQGETPGTTGEWGVWQDSGAC
jgi:predicted carbohydrate-binding protein with CBM5 and CBM33 domain